MDAGTTSHARIASAPPESVNVTSTSQTVRTVSLVIIAFVAGCAALFFGREFFVPIAFAVAFNVMLRPIVRAMERAKVPTSLAAAMVVLAILGLFAFAGWMLSDPIQNWMHEAPQRLKAAQSKLDRIRKPILTATNAVKSVQRVATGEQDDHAATTQATTTANAAPTTNPIKPVQEETLAPAEPSPGAVSPIAAVLGTTASLVSQTVEVILMLYLLLATGDLFLDKLVKILPRIHEKQKAVVAIHEVEVAVLQYVIATALINVGQAAVIGLALWWIGLPNALLWALATFFLEFIPYLGGALMVAMLSISAFATFDSFPRILAVPGSYLLVTTLQNNVVSPFAYGKRLKLNPVAVLIGVLFWWFVWGISGAFLAVPIVATVKVVCDRVQSLKPVGEFLGE